MVLSHPKIYRQRLNLALLGLLLLAARASSFITLGNGLGSFPESWNLGLREPMDAFKVWAIGNRKTHFIFLYFFTPLSSVIDTVLRQAEIFLLWLPWPVFAAAVFLAQRIANLRIALLTTSCLLLMGLVGYREESMGTLSLMLVSVIISLLVGIPLGIMTACSPRLEKTLRPLLDGMQTMPAFVYLIPVLLAWPVCLASLLPSFMPCPRPSA